jgi:hypothetical protein
VPDYEAQLVHYRGPVSDEVSYAVGALENEHEASSACPNLMQAQLAGIRAACGAQRDGGDHAEFTMAPAISFHS